MLFCIKFSVCLRHQQTLKHAKSQQGEPAACYSQDLAGRVDEDSFGLCRVVVAMGLQDVIEQHDEKGRQLLAGQV